MGCFKSNALALRHSHRSPRNESDSGRLFGSPAAFKFAIGASFKKLQSDSFQNDFAPHPILLFRCFNSELQQRCIDDMAEHRGWVKGGGQRRKSPAAMRAERATLRPPFLPATTFI